MPSCKWHLLRIIEACLYIIETRLSMTPLTWNDEVDRALIDAFLVEHRNGNKLEGR